MSGMRWVGLDPPADLSTRPGVGACIAIVTERDVARSKLQASAALLPLIVPVTDVRVPSADGAEILASKGCRSIAETTIQQALLIRVQTCSL